MKFGSLAALLKIHPYIIIKPIMITRTITSGGRLKNWHHKNLTGGDYLFFGFGGSLHLNASRISLEIYMGESKHIQL